MDTAFSAEESFPASADGRCREGRVLKGVVLFPYFQFHCSACKSTEYILDMLSCNVLIAHSVGDLEGEIRIFVEAEPGFCLAFRIVPDGGIFFGVFSHGLQLAEVGAMDLFSTIYICPSRSIIGCGAGCCHGRNAGCACLRE